MEPRTLEEYFIKEATELKGKVCELEFEIDKLKNLLEMRFDEIEELRAIVSEFEEACYDRACNEEPLSNFYNYVSINSTNHPKLTDIIKLSYCRRKDDIESFKELEEKMDDK